MTEIRLSDHFTYKRLLRFTLPSIAMMMFTSVYGIVDGFFVSNLVGKTAFASVNLIIPFLQILGGIGAMLGTGGGALVAKTLGEGDRERAGRYFTMITVLILAAGIVSSVAGICMIRPMAYLFGATSAMAEKCVVYGRICLIFNTALLAQYSFQNYLVVAERPKLGLLITLIAGVSNIALDLLFISVFRMGIAGAALATGLSECIGGLIPLIWFLSKKNRSQLHFRKTKLELRPVLKACANGSSEMLSSISGSITGILYNRQLMFYAGENGVAAYGVIMYTAFIFIAVFFGFCSGSAPIFGYQYGAGNFAELKSLTKKSLTLLGGSGLLMTGLAVLLARPAAELFVGYDSGLSDMTTHACRVCAAAFAFLWMNIFSSSFFTALNDGGVSAIISVLHSLLLPVVCILSLPVIFGLDGIWLSLTVCELLSLVVSIAFLIAKRKKYHY